jgi:putative ABC transport system substrate-binding protein
MQFGQLKRREVIRLIGGAAAWPLAARAQQPGMPVLGFLHSTSPGPNARVVAAFHQGLKRAGYTEGQNVRIEYRWAEGHYDRLPALAADLIRQQVAVIAALGGQASGLAAKAATSTIPIVFSSGEDPVKLGLVASFNQPSGNATGVSMLLNEVEAKRLGLLHELVPTAATIAVLLNPSTPGADVQSKDVQSAAPALGLKLHILNAGSPHEIDVAFASLAQLRPDALLVAASALFNSRRDQIVQLAARQSIPAIYEHREFAMAGGFVSYGIDLSEVYRQVGVYTGRILNGAKPAELPVIQPTRFELVINTITAKVLGLAVPDRLLAIADDVIE